MVSVGVLKLLHIEVSQVSRSHKIIILLLYYIMLCYVMLCYVMFSWEQLRNTGKRV